MTTSEYQNALDKLWMEHKMYSCKIVIDEILSDEIIIEENKP
jgi:hypothetical protein